MTDQATVQQDTPKQKGNNYQGFMSKLEQDEVELAELEKTRSKPQEDNKEAADGANVQDSDLSPEERTFKKRYGDLRRHSQKVEMELKQTIEGLRGDVDRLKGQLKAAPEMPKTRAEVEEFVKQHPDVAAILETMIQQRLKEKETEFNERFEEIETERKKTALERAKLKLEEAHPDYLELQNSEEFHDWVAEQPDWVQKALYENDSDWRSAARAIDLYKSDKGIRRKSRKTDTSEAAASVRVSSKAEEPGRKEKMIRESDIEKMTPAQFEAAQDEIQKAMQEGRIIYDRSGGAR